MMTSFRLKILVAVSFANTVGLTSAASLEDAVSAPPPVAAKSYEDPLVAKAGKLVAKLATTAASCAAAGSATRCAPAPHAPRLARPTFSMAAPPQRSATT